MSSKKKMVIEIVYLNKLIIIKTILVVLLPILVEKYLLNLFMILFIISFI